MNQRLFGMGRRTHVFFRPNAGQSSHSRSFAFVKEALEDDSSIERQRPLRTARRFLVQHRHASRGLSQRFSRITGLRINMAALASSVGCDS